MSEEGSLDIQPRELKFHFELHEQISCSVQVTNKSDQPVAFKVKTTHPAKYCVKPNAGVVLPRSTCDILVIMQAQAKVPPDMQCKDKFLIQSVVVKKGATTKDLTPETFKTKPGVTIDEFKLRVVFAQKNSLSTVTENAEEVFSTSSEQDNKALEPGATEEPKEWHNASEEVPHEYVASPTLEGSSSLCLEDLYSQVQSMRLEMQSELHELRSEFQDFRSQLLRLLTEGPGRRSLG